MLKQQLLPPSRQRLSHYSFMRSGDFIWFIFLIVFSTWKLWSAFALAERFFTEWFSYALLSCALTAVYAWLRIRRRNICADSGELMIAIMLPQLYSNLWKCLYGDPGELGWGWIAFMTVLCAWLIYQVWRAPKIAREMEELWAAAEEAARNAPAEPRYTHIEHR
jgi:hypothetical protein